MAVGVGLRAAGAATALVAAALAGCTATGPTSPQPSAPGTPQISARIVQYRTDEGSRTVNVQITNREKLPVRIAVAGLEWPGVTPPTAGNHARFGPGSTIDLPVTLGPFRCGDIDATTDPVVVLRLRAPGQAVRTARVTAGGRALLLRLRKAECEQRALARVVRIGYAPTWSAVSEPEPALEGTVVFRRRSLGRVAVVALDGIVLLDFRPTVQGRHPLLRMAPRQRVGRLPVTVSSSGRCDAHALGGSTQTFLLSAFVRSGAGPVQRVLLVPERPVQGRILAMVSRACEL